MFACQRNPYLRELKSVVISCKKVADKYHVLLDDTVLFPEGGGQPDDRGKIGDVNVERVFRQGNQAIHVLSDPVSEKEAYDCKIDWERRFDHMQQHSGQHLLSAIAHQKYGFKTTSWDLGTKVSNVEFDTPNITQEQINLIEGECNERIREHRDIIVHLMSKDEAMEVEEVKSRGLPEDVTENIRIVEMKGIEKNMCCGTHLSNTSEIQAIKLLHTESMRGGTRLFFLAGQRVVIKLASCIENEVSLTKLLSTGPDEHVKSIEKVQKSSKALQRNCKSYLKEVATLEALQIADVAKKEGAIFKHREDGDIDYINAFINQLKEKASECLIMVSAGEIKTGGMFVICGPESMVMKTGPKVAEVLDGKGGGKKNRYQGKASSFKKLAEAEKLVREILKE
eukprot:gene9431-17147_t